MWRREEARIRDSLWNFAFNGLRVTGIFHRQSFLPRKGKEKLTFSLCAALEKDRHRPRSFFLVIFIIEQSREKQINENIDVPRFYHFSNADVYRNVCMTKIGIEGRAKSFRVKSNNSAASCKYRVYNVKRHRGDGIRD